MVARHDRGCPSISCFHRCLTFRVVVHCFTGGRPALEQYVAMGFYVGITGFVAKRKRGVELRSFVAEALPLDRLLVETDAPRTNCSLE